MLVIDLRFPTGRFHSTPWGRNVNEGVPEWPPSPYRIIRALFDAWCRKRPQWEPERIRPILEALTSEPPRFDLPPAAASHTRSYLSKNTKDLDDKALIFDAFVSLCPTAHVRAAWPNASLDPQSTADLDELLSTLNYLGRSESWVEASLMPSAVDCKWNCFPKAAAVSGDAMESVRVACPMARAEYEANPYLPNSPRKSTKSKKPNAVPLLWLDALAYSTVDLLASGRSEPPAFKYVTYLRKAHCFDLEPTQRTAKGPHRINGALYALESKVPPPVTATLEIAEQVHVRLMGIHRRIAGGPERVSPRFSGKSRGGEPLRGHQHVYILPQDRNRDGHLDHLLVICKSAFDLEEQLALDRLNALWQPDGKPEIRCTPLQWGTIEELLEPATRFTSATPFIPPLHHRSGRGDFADWLVRQVVIEADNHGLPAPMRVTPVRRMENRGRDVAWLDFRRNRKGDSVRWEYGGFEIEFDQPVRGPFALGYGSHFGLGQFRPIRSGERNA
jgi:CRISPR-associated protein Csb2